MLATTTSGSRSPQANRSFSNVAFSRYLVPMSAVFSVPGTFFKLSSFDFTICCKNMYLIWTCFIRPMPSLDWLEIAALESLSSTTSTSSSNSVSTLFTARHSQAPVPRAYDSASPELSAWTACVLAQARIKASM